MGPTVFISYSHDSGDHDNSVLGLADKLRADGVDVRLDQYESTPAEGWPQWVTHQISTCTFVVLIFTPTYRSRYELAQRRETAEPDDQVAWETMTVRHLLYSAGGRNTKVIPVLFEGTVEDLVPLALRGSTHYQLPGGYEDLRRRLLDPSRRPPPPIGPRHKLPPEPCPPFENLKKANSTTPRDPSAFPMDGHALGHAPATARFQRGISTPAPPTRSGRPPTLLVFTANGAASRSHLRLDREFKAIKKVVGSRCNLIMSPDATLADVIRDLETHRPAMVHFGAHTDHEPESASLILASENKGDEIFVSPQQLANVLADIHPAPVLVTFTACFSTALAKAAAQHARYAIGFKDEFPDDWAPLFSGTLYDRLTSKALLDVPLAFKRTHLAWESEGQDVARQAQLYSKPNSESKDVVVSTDVRLTLQDPRPLPLDVLIVTALREELDALLSVEADLLEPWAREDGDPPLHFATIAGNSGPFRVAAVRLTEMAGIATATVTAPLLDALAPRALAMCGVCAGHAGDTDRGDVVIADRVFQYDLGKFKAGKFQGDLWVSTMIDPWLRAAQDLAGSARGLHGYGKASESQARWWFLEQLRDGRDPLHAVGLRRYILDERRAEMLGALRDEGLIALDEGAFTLTESGHKTIASHLAFHGGLVEQAPYHVHVGPMGSGNAVVADGKIWAHLAQGGMRKALAVEMEAATIGQLARRRGVPFAVAKGVMDHADAHKSDRFKAFAARAAAEVLCELLRRVVPARQ